MGIFGWSYPPGCSGPPDDDDDEGPCATCGRSVGDCICPECPVCQCAGDPHCYSQKGHGLTFNADQIERLVALERMSDEQAARDKAEGDYWRSQQADER